MSVRKSATHTVPSGMGGRFNVRLVGRPAHGKQKVAVVGSGDWHGKSWQVDVADLRPIKKGGGSFQDWVMGNPWRKESSWLGDDEERFYRGDVLVGHVEKTSDGKWLAHKTATGAMQEFVSKAGAKWWIAKGPMAPNPHGRRSRDVVTFRGEPARVVAGGLSLAEVRRHNPAAAEAIDAAGGVALVAVDAGAGNEAAVMLADGEVVAYEDLAAVLDLERAGSASAEFHGRAPRFVETRIDEMIEHDTITALGDLVELGIYSETADGRPAETPLRFAKSEGVVLGRNVPNEQTTYEGRKVLGDQLFIVGKTRLDDRTLRRLGVDRSELDKQYVSIGPLVHIVYHTSKKVHDWKPTDYIHQMGELVDGLMPQLFYDQLNGELYIVGGSYVITERGIEN